MKQSTRNRFYFYGQSLAALSILLTFAILPASVVRLLTPAPQTRNISIEAFRYGFSPSRIHVNRGDRLRLSFSTRDTGQSFFLQDYDLFVVITPGSKLVEVHRLSRPDDPPTREEVVELTAGQPGWRGLFVSKSQFRNHTYNGPMHGTERGDLIVGPNYLLAGGLGLLCALPLAGLLAARRSAEVESRRRAVDLFELIPWLKGLVKRPSFQFNLTVPMLAVFYFLILAGLIGTKVSGRNAGPMVIWVLWLSTLIILLVPLGGRIWCLVCPLPSLGELLQRRRVMKSTPESEGGSPRYFPGLPRIWPGWMSNAWPRLIFFLLLGTFSTVLVALPPATSWLLIGLAFLAIVTSIFPEQRLFCRYLCPINSFISVYSMTGRLMARSVSSSTCAKCEERFCLAGSAKGWGCPYGLCMGEVNRNNDCGMCTECVKTCAYDNVAFFWRRSGWDTKIATYAEAWQAIVMFGLSVIYCVVNLGAWHQIRDWIDIVDKQNWRTFWAYGIILWVVCLGALPFLLYRLTKLGLYVSKSRLHAGSLFRACSAALIPLGLSCWIAFALAMVLSMMTFVLQSLSDPFNWGWDLFGTAGSRWHILWAPAIPWLQVACVVIGGVYSLRTLQFCWQDHATEKREAFLGSLPLASFLWIAAAGMIWFFAG
jgi:polyferredoxin